MVKNSLKTRLIFTVYISFIVSMLASIFIQYSFLYSKEESLAKSALNNAHESVELKLTNLQLELKNISEVIATDTVVLATLNLLNKYQDKNNYQALLFDEEKKTLLEHIMGKFSFIENYSFTLYDKEYEPIILKNDGLNLSQGAIVTYNRGVSIIKSSKDKVTKFNVNDEKIKIYKNLLGNVFYKSYPNSKKIFLSYAIKITSKSGEELGFIKVEKSIEENFLNSLKNLNEVKVSFTFEGVNVGELFLPEKEFSLVNSQDDFDFLVGDNYFFSKQYVKTILDNKLELILAYDKTKLNDSLIEMLKIFFYGLVITLIIIVPVIAIFFERNIFKPVSEITRGIESYKEGEFQPIELNVENEFKLIADKFNDISKSLDLKQKELIQSEDLLKNIINTAPIKIFWKDTELKYIGCNKEYLKDLDLEKEKELIGLTDFDIKWNEYVQHFKEEDEIVLNGETIKAKEKTLLDVQGNEKVIVLSKIPLKDADENIIGVLGIYRDVTQERSAQQALHDKEQMLFQQSKMAAMGEMIGNIAHQWRQPINAIGIILQKIPVLQRREKLTPEVLKTNVDKGMKIITQMSTTIDDFRDFFKPNKNKVTFKIEEAFFKTKDLFGQSYVNNSIEIIENIESVEVTTLFNELVQVIMNILNNSKDVLINANGRRLVFIDIKKRDNFAVIVIKDNGGGINDDIIEKIFEPYFTTKDKDQGTGIGLYMSFEMVKKHIGGTISAENCSYKYEEEEYKGAEFTIKIPLS